VHSDQPKPNLRRKRKALSGLEGLLKIVSLEVIRKSVRAGTHSESWKETIPDGMNCNVETVGAK